MREAKLRKIAREVARLLQDGRPQRCTCPPNPFMGALPADNRHFWQNEACPINEPRTDIRPGCP